MSDAMELVVNNEQQPHREQEQLQQEPQQQEQQGEVTPFTTPTTTITELTTTKVGVNDSNVENAAANDGAITQRNTKRYYAIRVSPKLDGSAIFTSYHDCKSYVLINDSVDGNEGEGNNDVEKDLSTLQNATSDATEATAAATDEVGTAQEEGQGGKHRQKIEYSSFDDWDDAVEYIEVFLADITNSANCRKKKAQKSNKNIDNEEDENENNHNRKRKFAAASSSSSSNSTVSSESSTTAAKTKNKKAKSTTASPVADRREEQFNRHFDTNYERLIEFQNDYGDCGTFVFVCLFVFQEENEEEEEETTFSQCR